MTTGIKVLPSTLQKVNISNEYAPGFLSSVSSNIIKNPGLVLRDEIIGKLKGSQLSLDGMFRDGKSYIDIDLPIDVSDKSKATSDMAFITFMLSKYHKEHRKNGSAARFAINVGDSKPIEFYCMKNYTYAGDESYTTDNDVILASILGLNATVKCLRKNNMAGMHPLSRTAITEEGVDQLSDFLMDSDTFQNEYSLNAHDSKNTAVKLYNTACARKCHQFTGITKYYIPELAAAQLIMGVMSSKSQSSALIDITNRNIAKISRAAGTLSKSLMMDFMDFCKPPGSQYDIVEIFNAYKNKSKKRVESDYPSVVETIQSFKYNDVPRRTITESQVGEQGSSSGSGKSKTKKKTDNQQKDEMKDLKKHSEELAKKERELSEQLEQFKRDKAQFDAIKNNVSDESSVDGKDDDQFDKEK